MKIEIWSDVICPFCYIGKTQLEAALAETGLSAEIEHRAFRLMPGEAPYPIEEMFARRYGQSPEQAKASMANVETMAAGQGLEFHIPGTKAGDTTDAHKLLILAGDRGVQPELLDALYRAYFTDSRDVFNRDVLVTIAEEAGLDRAEAEKALASEELKARVAADQRSAETLNVRGVPFVVIDRKIAVSGAQGTANFVKALMTAEPAPPTDGDACGIDGCDPA